MTEKKKPSKITSVISSYMTAGCIVFAVCGLVAFVLVPVYLIDVYLREPWNLVGCAIWVCFLLINGIALGIYRGMDKRDD